MGKFLLGIIVVLLAGVAIYYFMLMDVQEAQNAEPQSGASLNLDANPIPQGAMMEDGTLD